MNKISIFIDKLLNREHLTALEAEEAMNIMIKGGANPTQTATYLTALKMQDIYPEQIIGCTNYFSRIIAPKSTNQHVYSLSFTDDNSSTSASEIAVSLVLSSFGISMIKNFSSILPMCQSINALTKNGYNFDLTLIEVAEILQSNNIVFTQSKNFYPKMIDFNFTREALKFTTIIDVIEPLVQQIKLKNLIIAAPNCKHAFAIATALKALSYEHAIIFYNELGTASMIPGINNIIILAQNILSETKLELPKITATDFNEIDIFLLTNEDKNFTEFVCFNSAALLFLLKISLSFEEALIATKTIFTKHIFQNNFRNLVGATNNFLKTI